MIYLHQTASSCVSECTSNCHPSMFLLSSALHQTSALLSAASTTTVQLSVTSVTVCMTLTDRPSPRLYSLSLGLGLLDAVQVKVTEFPTSSDRDDSSRIMDVAGTGECNIVNIQECYISFIFTSLVTFYCSFFSI